MSQYCYFGIYSITASVEDISRQIGILPDTSHVRASKSAKPPRPVANAWKIEAQNRNARIDDQLVEIVGRLSARREVIANLISRLRTDPAEEGHGGATLQAVRYFDDPEGVDEVGAIGPGGLAKMAGQHQLVGWCTWTSKSSAS